MRDTNWELVKGDDASTIEYLNYANQLNVVEAMFIYYAHCYGNGESGCPKPLNSDLLRELHRAATLFLLSKPGEYRDTHVHVVGGGDVIYDPPAPGTIPFHMREFEKELSLLWATVPAIELAAFALWKINWIHPFKNGNGRSARAFAYACLCLRHGFILPGEATIVDLLMEEENTVEYRAHLAWADKTFREADKTDLAPMASLLDRLLEQQLNSVTKPLSP